MNESNRFAGFRLLVGSAALVILVAGLVAGRPLLAPFTFAVLVSIMGLGPVHWLQARRVPGPAAVVVVAVVIAGVMVGIGSLLVTSINQLVETLPEYQDSLTELFVWAQTFLARYGLQLTLFSVYDQLEPATLMEMTGNLFRGLLKVVSSTGTAIVIIIFVLFEAADYRVKLAAALHSSMDYSRLERVATDVQRYLFVKTITSGLTGILVALSCASVGVDFPLLWGLLAFLLNYIPVVGSIVAAIPAILLAIAQLGLLPATILSIGYLVVNLGISNFLEPALMGRQLGLSPLVVFLSLVFWGWVWGPMGMLLAVPVTMLIKILLEYSEDLQWVAILMDHRRNIDGERHLGDLPSPEEVETPEPSPV